jgi:hypothetical protein
MKNHTAIGESSFQIKAEFGAIARVRSPATLEKKSSFGG